MTIVIAEEARRWATRDRPNIGAGLDEQTSDHAVRERVARDLHDSVARTLLTMLLELETFKADQSGRESVLREIDVFKDFVRSALTSLRDTLNDLHDEPDLDEGLVVAVRHVLVPNFERRYRIPVTVSVTDTREGALPPEIELTVYRVAQEALVNAGRHSQANTVSISLRVLPSGIALDIVDDGKGYSSREAAGFGRRSMRDRALIAGGRLRIDSEPGAGTRVRLRVPLMRVTDDAGHRSPPMMRVTDRHQSSEG